MTATENRPRILPKQAVTARDGVDLVGDVFLPDELPSSPTVLVRTPYGRGQTLLLQLASQLRAQGLSILLQDCRGRYGSGGEVDLLRERDDTEDTLLWVADQPWNDGSVGFLGMSISSLQFFPLAVEPPEGIRVGAMVNLMGARNLYTMIYRDGAVLLHWALPWFHLISSTGNGWQSRPWEELYRHFPLESVPEEDFDLSKWREVLASPTYGSRWQPLDASPFLPRLDVPTLSVSGWHDFMLDQALDSFAAMAAATPGRHKLIVGPWDHQSLLGNFSRAQAAVQKRGAVDLSKLVVSWFERWLRPEFPSPSARAWDHRRDVSLFVVGEERWIAADGYPLAQARTEELFLSSTGDAAGDGGELVRRTPEPGEDAFTFEADNPVPTVGGAVWPFAAAGLQPGPADQSEVERRPDVLVYTSAPLQSDLIAAGPIEVRLWASTSAPNTDFTAKLVDVGPSGAARVVQDGIVRASHALPADRRPLAPGTTYPWRIDLQATAYRFPAGHRLRLEISSSNFPKFDRCVTGADPSAEAHHQRVFHGGQTPSRLRLTVLPEGVEALRAPPPGSPESERPPGRTGLPTRERLSAAAQRIMRPVMLQFGRPRGALGWFVGKMLAYYNRELNRCALRHLEVEPADHVLEVGYGPGLAIQRIAERAVDGRVVGVDHSEVMFRSARRRNSEAIEQGRVELLHGPVETLDFPPGSFDKVLTVNSIQLFPAPVEVLRKMLDVLKEGGHLVVARQPRSETTSRDRVHEMAAQISRWMKDAGFGSVRTVIEPAKPVAITCVVGTKPTGGRTTHV